MDVPTIDLVVVAITDADVGFVARNIKIDDEKCLAGLHLENFGGGDIEKPPGPRLIGEINDTVRKQHLPVQGMAMPGFSADESGEICSQTSRMIFCSVHELLQ